MAEWTRPVERIKDEAELSHTVTWLALITTGAESAMFHYRGRNQRTLITRSVIGPISNERLGYALPKTIWCCKQHAEVAQCWGRPMV